MAFPRFPYTDFHSLNADWILNKMREMAQTVEQYAEDLSHVVRVTAQSFNNNEKQQARENIGAASATELQQTQATLTATRTSLAETQATLSTVQNTTNDNADAISAVSLQLVQHGLDITAAQGDIAALQATSFRDVVVTLTSTTEGYISADQISFTDFQNLNNFYRLAAYEQGIPVLVGCITQALLVTAGDVSNPRLAVQKSGLYLVWTQVGTEPYEGRFNKTVIVLTWDTTNSRTAVHMIGLT